MNRLPTFDEFFSCPATPAFIMLVVIFVWAVGYLIWDATAESRRYRRVYRRR